MREGYGAFRTQLTGTEKRKLKDIAKEKGMTLTGLHDAVMREVIKAQGEKR